MGIGTGKVFVEIYPTGFHFNFNGKSPSEMKQDCIPNDWQEERIFQVNSVESLFIEPIYAKTLRLRYASESPAVRCSSIKPLHKIHKLNHTPFSGY